MTTDMCEPEAPDDEFVIALTPVQIGVALAIVIVLIIWIRARRKRSD